MNIGYFKHKTKACGFDNMVFHLVRYMCWIQIMYTCLDNILPIKDIFWILPYMSGSFLFSLVVKKSLS